MSTALTATKFPSLVQNIFIDLQKKFEENGQKEYSSSDLLELSGLFDIELLEASLDLIDRNRLKLYTTSSQIREIVEIQSSSRDGFSLKLFPNTNYCPCRYFRELVAQRHERFTCKHILATKLAIIGKQIQVEIVNDDLFSFLIKQIGEQLRTEIVV